jgi:hypothetical protein
MAIPYILMQLGNSVLDPLGSDKHFIGEIQVMSDTDIMDTSMGQS